MMTGQNEIDEKLLQYVLDELNDVERKEVESWLRASEMNRTYFNEFLKVHMQLRWGVYAREVRTDFSAVKKRLRKRLILRVWRGVAAVAFLLLSVGVAFWWNEKDDLSVRENVKINPGKSQAVLVLSTGEKIEMGDVSRDLKERDGTTLQVDETGQIMYNAGENERIDSEVTEEMMNRLLVPRGGEFNLTLSDGTRVWLNSETELFYPIRFNGKQRVVYLKGEAYFSVVKDAEKPFWVQMNDVSVKVYGTEFNVNTYESVEAVLVKGSVSINQGGREVLLKPSQKGVFDKSKGEIFVEDVDVLPYVAWKDGDFIFRNESLGSIMDKLSRWYGLEVFYQNKELREVRLSGNLKRYKDVRELFHSFEKISDANFKVQGNTVFVNSCN